MPIKLTYNDLVSKMNTAGQATSLASNAANILGATTSNKTMVKIADNLSVAERIVNSISGMANNKLVAPFVADAIAKYSGVDMKLGDSPMKTPEQSTVNKPKGGLSMDAEQIYSMIRGSLLKIQETFGKDRDITVREMLERMEKNKPVVVLLIEKGMKGSIPADKPTEQKVFRVGEGNKMEEITNDGIAQQKNNDTGIAGKREDGVGKENVNKSFPKSPGV